MPAEMPRPTGPPAPNQIPAALTTASTSSATPRPSRRCAGSISRVRPTARPVALPSRAMPRPTASILRSMRSGPCLDGGLRLPEDGRRAGARRLLRGAGMRVAMLPGWAAIARPAACAADRAAVFLLPLLAVVRPATGSR